MLSTERRFVHLLFRPESQRGILLSLERTLASIGVSSDTGVLTCINGVAFLEAFAQKGGSGRGETRSRERNSCPSSCEQAG